MRLRLREWLVRILGSLVPGRQARDLEEELRLHLELAAEHERRLGTPAEEARRTAVFHAGHVTQAMNALRDQQGLRWLEDGVDDLRYGLRALRRSPIFAAVVVMSLALGIGANSALFSLVDATLLRELPVAAPRELVQLGWRSRSWFPDMSRFGGSGSVTVYGRRSPTFSNSAFENLRVHATTLSEVFAFSRIMPVSVATGRGADTATMQLVSGDYFGGLRTVPVIGRFLTAADDNPGSEPAAVISHRLWRTRFAQDPGVLQTAVRLDRLTVTIVGIAPEDFRGVASAGAPGPDFWIPLAFGSWFGSKNTERGFWWLSVMGRLQPGVSVDQVRGNLAGTFQAAVRETENVPADDPPDLHVWSARRGAREEGPEDELEHAVILGVIFGTLLLVICLNVANLLVSRSAARRTEIGVRLALGASRGRLIRQLLAESIILSVGGGALGIVLAYWGKGLFGASTLVHPDLDLRIDGAVAGVTLLVSTLTGVFFGLVPALSATRSHQAEIVQRAGLRGGLPSRLNRALLVTQVATAVVLLIGAGLFVRTLGNWQRIDAGFDTRNLLVFQVNPASLGYDEARTASLQERLATRIRAVPGLTRMTTSGAFWRERWFDRFFIDGQRRRPVPHWLSVRHDFFETLGLPVLAGRGFQAEENDRTGPPAVAVIDETLARQFFGNANPIGHRVSFRTGGPDIEIVGVVRKMSMPGTRPENLPPRVYLPGHTRPSDFDPDWAQRSATWRLPYEISFEIRTASDPLAVLPAIRSAVAEMEPDLPLLDPKTVEQGLSERLSSTRVASFIWLAFGAVTLILTAVGLYGLLAYTVVQRTREIGIRTALGARRLAIVRLVTGQILGLVFVGIWIGVALSMGVGQVIRAFTFGVTFYDPPTIAVVMLIIGVVASFAALLPARRASRLDPTIALRCE